MPWQSGLNLHKTLHPDWLVPDWPAPPHVRAVFTTRAGGMSALPFDSMNLGDHVGDLPATVVANRSLLQDVTGTRRAVFLKQVHGARVQLIDPASTDGQLADACVTVHPKLACTVMVADCLPVLLTTQKGLVVAAVHAGWRGLVGNPDTGEPGVIESAYASFRALARLGKQSGSTTIAWLGPCIGPSAFEVGAEVKAVFESVQPEAVACFLQIAPDKYLADLPGLARLRLQALGITQVYGNDGSLPWCTVANPSRFFSHRRDAGIPGNGFTTTGRMAACIWLDG